mgnify:CR=1 FL=1
MLDDTWRQTFTVLENKIISFWFKETESSNVCYQLLKIVCDILMPMDQLGEAILKTYALKTAFLHECEQYPEARFWTKNEISTTSFPGSFISPPQRERGKKDPGSGWSRVLVTNLSSREGSQFIKVLSSLPFVTS